MGGGEPDHRDVDVGWGIKEEETADFAHDADWQRPICVICEICGCFLGERLQAEQVRDF